VETKAMTQKEIQRKYAAVKKQLHTCKLKEQKALYALMNFYYNKLN